MAKMKIQRGIQSGIADRLIKERGVGIQRKGLGDILSEGVARVKTPTAPAKKAVADNSMADEMNIREQAKRSYRRTNPQAAARVDIWGHEPVISYPKKRKG